MHIEEKIEARIVSIDCDEHVKVKRIKKSITIKERVLEFCLQFIAVYENPK